MFLGVSVLSTKLYYLLSVICGCQSSESLVFLLVVVEFSFKDLAVDVDKTPEAFKIGG
jgi:hypothetical protein